MGASEGFAGLGYATRKAANGAARSPRTTARGHEPLAERMGLGPDDGIFFAAGKEEEAAKLAGAARTRVGEQLDLIEKGAFRFCWIVDFPMFEYNDEQKKIDFSHNPFSMPQGELEALETKDPLDILAWQYDIVCNGVELSSGAIRNHRPDIMYKAFEIAGYTREEVDTNFSGMINAFKFGAPPHGGSAPGIDRIVMLLADEPNIREVILFPMNQKAEDLMMNAPAPVMPKQLRWPQMEAVSKQDYTDALPPRRARPRRRRPERRRAADRADQPALHRVPGADQRPHRLSKRSPRARWSPPTRPIRWPRSPGSTRSMSTSSNRRRPARAAQALAAGRRPTSTQVRLKLPDGSDYGFTGTVQFSEVMVDQAPARSRSAPASPIRRRSCCPACSSRRASPRRSTPAPSWCRRRRCRAIPRAMRRCVFVVGPGNKAVQRTVVADRTSGRNIGSSPRASRPARR
jgi:hypothetical protein